MTFIDWMTIAGTIASFAGLFASTLKRFEAYRQWLLGFGLFFLGMVTAKLLDAIFPVHGLGYSVTPRELAWAVILIVGSFVVLMATIKEGARTGVIVGGCFIMMVGINAAP